MLFSSLVASVVGTTSVELFLTGSTVTMSALSPIVIKKLENNSKNFI